MQVCWARARAFLCDQSGNWVNVGNVSRPRRRSANGSSRSICPRQDLEPVTTALGKAMVFYPAELRGRGAEAATRLLT